MELLARAEAIHEKKQIEEARLQLKIKEEELDIQTALKISDARTKIIEELERTELREKQLTEALSDIQLELDQQPLMFVPVTKTTVSQPALSVLHSDLNPHAPFVYISNYVKVNCSAELKYPCFYSDYFKKWAHRCAFVYAT